MAWKVTNYIQRSDVKVRKWFWTSDPIRANGGEYTSDRGSWFDELDITIEGCSGYFWEIVMNPTIIATSVSPAKETHIVLNDGGYDSRKRKYTINVEITDNKGRKERKKVEADTKWD